MSRSSARRKGNSNAATRSRRSTAPSFLVDGIDHPALQTSLQSVGGELAQRQEDDAGGDLQRLGVGRRRFARLSLERRADLADRRDAPGRSSAPTRPSAAPWWRSRASSPAALPPCSLSVLKAALRPARPLSDRTRCVRASDLLRFDAAVERTGPTRTTGRVNAEAVATLALGPAALRPGMSVDVFDVGAIFEGPYILTTVSLHFDVTRGLRAEFAAQR